MAARKRWSGGRRAVDDAVGRQQDRDGGAAPECAVDRECAAMELDQALDEGQAEAAALVAAGEPVVDLAEACERDSDVFGRHADAGIGDDDGDVAAAPLGG